MRPFCPLLALVLAMASGCGGGKDATAIAPGLYQAKTLSSALVPYLAVTDGKGAGEEGEQQIFFFERESYGHGSSISSVAYIDGDQTVSKLPLDTTTGQPPRIEYKIARSREDSSPRLGVAVEAAGGSSSKRFVLEYTAVPREAFAEGVLSDEGVGALSFLNTQAKAKDRDTSAWSQEPALYRFCARFDWGKRCDRLYQETDL